MLNQRDEYENEFDISHIELLFNILKKVFANLGDSFNLSEPDEIAINVLLLIQGDLILSRVSKNSNIFKKQLIRIKNIF